MGPYLALVEPSTHIFTPFMKLRSKEIDETNKMPEFFWGFFVTFAYFATYTKTFFFFFVLLFWALIAAERSFYLHPGILQKPTKGTNS